jgi:hypothetical protein
MIGDVSIQPADDGIILPASYTVDVDLGDNLIFRFEDWGKAKFGIFFFDDIGLGIPIFAVGYCTNLTEGDT